MVFLCFTLDLDGDIVTDGLLVIQKLSISVKSIGEDRIKSLIRLHRFDLFVIDARPK